MPRRRQLSLLVVPMLLVAIVSPLGCTTTIIPPTAPADPVPVFLLDHGRTASLVIPLSDDTMIRYAYGEWEWYAHGNTGFFRALGALFWPTHGTLGYKQFTGPLDATTVHANVLVEIDNLYTIHVARDRVLDLHDALQKIYADHLHTELHSPASDLTFVRLSRSYTLFFNSNHAVAEWLRALGCDVRGSAIQSRWRIQETR